NWPPAEPAGAGPDGFVEPFGAELVDDQAVGLRQPPVEEVVGADVGPALGPAVEVGQKGDPGFAAHLEVMPAVANVSPVGELLAVEPDPAAGAVGGQRDLRQWTARQGHVLVSGGEGDHAQSERPPSTTRTWPVMNPAAGEQRKATAAATSSAVPSRPSGVNFTSSATMSSVSEAAVSSVLMMSSQSAAVIRSSSLSRTAPALFTSTSMRPVALTVFSTSACSVTSQRTALPSISWATCSAAALSER